MVFFFSYLPPFSFSPKHGHICQSCGLLACPTVLTHQVKSEVTYCGPVVVPCVSFQAILGLALVSVNGPFFSPCLCCRNCLTHYSSLAVMMHTPSIPWRNQIRTGQHYVILWEVVILVFTLLCKVLNWVISGTA